MPTLVDSIIVVRILDIVSALLREKANKVVVINKAIINANSSRIIIPLITTSTTTIYLYTASIDYKHLLSLYPPLVYSLSYLILKYRRVILIRTIISSNT